MPFIEALGQQMISQAASQAMGGLGGAIFGKGADRRQRKQQEKLNIINQRAHEAMTEYNMKKQLEMWEKTGYGAQIKQIKDAGLNAGLIYGMGGAGGQSSNVDTGSAATATAPNEGMSQFAGMGMQGGLIPAQIDLIKAQTENVKADTTKKSGVDTEKGWAEIDNLFADTKNKEANTKWQSLKTKLDEIELKFNSNQLNYEAREDILIQAARQAKEIGDQMETKTGTDRMAQRFYIETMRTELARLGIESQLKEAQINLTKEQTTAISEGIAQAWENVAQGWENLGIQDQKNVIQREINQLTERGIITQEQRLELDKKIATSDNTRSWFETITNLLPWKRVTTGPKGTTIEKRGL